MTDSTDHPANYDIVDEGEFLVVRLADEVDLYSSPHAREVILNCLDQNRGVLVDLSAVKYIDSSGIASLVEGYQLAKNKTVEFGLIGLSEAAMNVLQLAHLDKVFPIYASLADRRKRGGG